MLVSGRMAACESKLKTLRFSLNQTHTQENVGGAFTIATLRGTFFVQAPKVLVSCFHD